MKKLLFYIIDKEGRCYTKQGSNVLLVNDYVPIKYSPIGWNDTNIGWERDTGFLHGVIRNFGQGYSFPLDGGTILRALFYPGKIEEEVYLLIQQFKVSLDALLFADEYHTVYKGLFDLSTFNDDRVKVSIDIGDKGFNKLFHAKKDTVYQFEIGNDSEAVFLRNDGTAYKQQSTNIVTNGALDNDYGNHLVGIINANAEVKVNLGASEVERKRFNLNDDLLLNGTPFLTTSNYLADVVLEYKFDVNIGLADGIPVHPGAGTAYQIRGFDSDNNVAFAQRIIELGTGAALYTTHSVEGTVTITPPVNTRLYLLCILTLDGTLTTGSLSDVVSWTYSGNDMKFNYSYFYRYPATYTRMYQPQTLARKVVEKIGSFDNYEESNLLNIRRGLLITSGDALRRITGAKLKISANQLLKSLNVMLGACTTIVNDKLHIVTYQDVYNFDNVIALGGINKPEFSYAKELVPNLIKIGYIEEKTDDVNGKLEFNNTASYSPPTVSGSKTLELISDISAAIYKIEQLRINFDGKSTTDDTGDNGLFVVDSIEQQFSYTVPATFDNDNGGIMVSNLYPDVVNMEVGMKFVVTDTASNNTNFTVIGKAAFPGTTLIIVAEPFISEVAAGATFTTIAWVPKRVSNVSSGVPSPSTVYNVELSPAHLMKIHEPYLNSLMWDYVGGKFKFNTADKNQELVSITDGITYIEKADIPINNNRLFISLFANFESLVPVNLPDILETSPASAFSFVVEGLLLKGILFKAGISLATGKEQEFRVALAPDTDTLKLIK